MTESLASPESEITSIKSGVARSIESADQDVRVRTTDYFNNTYVPDLVLSWPREGVERQVFLRTNANVDYLIEDLALASDPRSIFMPLAAVRLTLDDDDVRLEAAREDLQNASRERKALVTDPQAFAALGDQQYDAPVVELASRSLLQGGIGFVPRSRAAGFGRSLADGFDGAQEPSPTGRSSELVQEAVETAEQLLDKAHASEVTSFLHAVWVGSGGDGTLFPSGEGVTASPTGAGLDLLLRTVTIDDPQFWKRMAQSLSFSKLSEMTAATDQRNFQYLIHAAVNVLKAKGIRVVDGVPGEPGVARWFVAQGTLGLRFNSMTALIASSRIGDLPVEGVGITTTITDLQRRASRADVRLTGVTVGTAERHFDYGSEDGDAITQDQQLRVFADALGSSAEVRRAVAQVGSREMYVDFATSTAYGPTSGVFYLSELVEHLPLLADFSRRDIAMLVTSALGAEVHGDAGEGA